eukprot:5687092-Amphidinium_carterae.3
MLPTEASLRRPIGITCLLFRAWSRVRLRLLLEWARQADLPGTWGTSSKRTEFATWVVAARAKFAATVRCSHASLLLDLHKFYEFVSHSRLVRATSLRGVALRLIKLAACSYASPQAIVVDGMQSDWTSITGSNIPGCALATRVVLVLFAPMLQATNGHRRKHLLRLRRAGGKVAHLASTGSTAALL